MLLRSRLVLPLIVGLFSCAVLSAPAPCWSGTITLASDPTGNVFALMPDGTQGSLIGAAECYNHPHPGDFGSACPIWLPNFTASTPADLVGGYFNKTIFIPGAPLSGSVIVAVDDMVEIRVNGIVVGSKGSITDLGAAAAAQSTATPFDLTPFLQSGTNLLTFRAQNGPAWFTGGACDPCGFSRNPAGLIFSGSITYEAATPTVARTWGALKTHYR